MKRKRLIKKIIRRYEIELLTGLHVGGNKENIEIGGMDNPVIRDPLSNEPYIPGSSIKGKMRSLLEISAGIPEVGGGSQKNKSEEANKINRAFGYANDDLPSALIFGDAFLTEETKQQLKNIRDRLDAEYTELKFENVINRITGKADHPRQTERVPKGAKFEFEIIMNIWEYDNGQTNEQELNEMLEKGIKLLENDYLGGSGSRGYGRIKIKELENTRKEINLTELWQA